ncbi:hypothetical protein D6764_00365 [Candidatus Woesearchaeota archaeon]|nr:MAG: hypothetical protein D6764_00365 [Candidatus Woesearchaeota archaeon]
MSRVEATDTISLSTILKHYKRADIQEAMIKSAVSREVAVRMHDRFGKRPDILSHPKDILEFAKKGVTSFHVSEERWVNPLALSSELSPDELAELRTGWDLVLDIDCHFIEYSKIAAKLCIDALRNHGIKSVSVKFSGNKGFHIGVPFEAFPKKVSNTETRLLFPEAARKIAMYIKEIIAKPLSEAIMNFENRDFGRIVEKTGKKAEEIIEYETDPTGRRIPVINAKPFLDIDTILISSRHLYRMVYSLHEKSGLVSVPLDPDFVMFFERESARPEKVEVSSFEFLNPENAVPDEARMLFIQALDFSQDSEKNEDDEMRERFEQREYEIPENAIPEKFFPPCIRKMLMGLADGRKRALFVLVGFLSNVGWTWEQIERYLLEWNKRNKPPLSETLVRGQIRYRKMQKKLVMPPNSTNKNYYDDIGVEHSDPLCIKLKNPVNYAKFKSRNSREDNSGRSRRKPRKKEEEQNVAENRDGQKE